MNLKKRKKGFTLIELIVVIAVLGVLILLSMPKFLGYNEKALNTAVKADLKTVQTAVNMKIIDNKGISPYNIEIGDAKKLEVNTLKPQYIASLKSREGYEFWIDGWDIVYYNGINPPENVNYENGTLSWDEVEEADKYNIYKISDNKQVSLLELIGIRTVVADSGKLNAGKKLYKTIEELSIELPEGNYLVSAANKKTESVAVGSNFKGGIIGEDDKIEEILEPVEKEPVTPENLHDDEFDIKMNDDVTRKDDGTFTFESGTWTYSGNNPQFLSENNELRTGGTRGAGYYGYSLPTTMKTATFQLTVKNLMNNAGMNAEMFFRTGDTGIGIYFYPNRIEIYDLISTPIKTHYLDATQYHVYRIVKEDKKATVYIDGEKIDTFTLRSGSGYGENRFTFGDGTSSTANSETYYKEIKIAPGKALHY